MSIVYNYYFDPHNIYDRIQIIEDIHMNNMPLRRHRSSSRVGVSTIIFHVSEGKLKHQMSSVKLV